MAKPKNKLGVVWIDAHADLHTLYHTSGNMHGMPLSVSLAEDNKKFKVHDLDEKQYALGAIKNIGKISPKVLPEDIVFISLRDFEKKKHIIEKIWHKGFQHQRNKA